MDYPINFHEDDTADLSEGYAILLTTVEAKFLSPFFPALYGVPCVDDRRVLGRIKYVLVTGCR